MDSIKQRQVASLVKRHLAELFVRKGSQYYGRAFVTISEVKMTPDLLVAKVYLSIFNVKEKDQVLRQMNQNLYDIKRELFSRIRNKLRRMPEILFFLEESLDQINDLEKIFREIGKKDGDFDS